MTEINEKESSLVSHQRHLCTDAERFIFADETLGQQKQKKKQDEVESKKKWKIIVIDDEKEVHDVTRLVLSGVTFESKGLDIYSSYSASEAKELLKNLDDVALILLDVVMETDIAGLDLVKYIRNQLKARDIRIILCTGQPGLAPASEVVVEYDINDYKTKSELTSTQMVTSVINALRSYRDIKEIEQLKESAERFVPYEFLSLLQKREITDVHLGDHAIVDMTVMFSDIRSFTALSENMTAKQSFEFINTYLGHMEPIINQNHGYIDKYIGDGIIALFSDPPSNAVNCALAMLKELEYFNQQNAHLYPPIKIGIGIHTGTIMLGIIGGKHRLEGTAISDVVNVTARIEELTKRYKIPLLISQDVFKTLKDNEKYKIRSVGEVTLAGKSHPLKLYEVFDTDSSSLNTAKSKTKEDFEKAIALFRSGDKDGAKKLFYQCLKENQEDELIKYFINQCEI